MPPEKHCNFDNVYFRKSLCINNPFQNFFALNNDILKWSNDTNYFL